MSGLLRFGPMGHGGLALLLVFALFSCAAEQGGPTGEEAPAKPVTREVTKTVTMAEAPEEQDSAAPEAARVASAPPKPAPAADAPVESASAYVTVADGALSVEVPSSWGEVLTGEGSEAGSSWSEFAGESVDYSLTAAPSLGSWGTAPGSPGVYAVASEGLAQRYADEELVAAGPNDLSGACEAGTQSAFERGPYSGLVQEWGSCGEAGGAYLTLAAAPEGRECVVLLQVGTAGQEGAEAGQHVLDTFGADCGPPAPREASVAAYAYEDEATAERTAQEVQYAPEQAAKDSEPDPTPQYETEVPLTDHNPLPVSEVEALCAELGKVRAGRGCVFPEDASDVPLTDAEEGTDEIEVPEPPPGDEEPVPPPTDQYDPPEPSPQNPGYDAPEPPVASEPPPSSSGYPPFPGDPFNGPTCDEVGGGPYSVPPGSPRDSNGDGVACE